jgi:hypothetical protein
MLTLVANDAPIVVACSASVSLISGMGLVERQVDRLRPVIERRTNAIVGRGEPVLDARCGMARQSFEAICCSGKATLDAVSGSAGHKVDTVGAAGERAGEGGRMIGQCAIEAVLVFGVGIADFLSLVGEGAGNARFGTGDGIEQCVGAGFQRFVEAVLAVAEGDCQRHRLLGKSVRQAIMDRRD